MTVIELLENELKRVRKINYRLINRPKGTVQEKDLERYKREMEENDKYERDLIESLVTLRCENTKKKDTEYGEYSGKAYVKRPWGTIDSYNYRWTTPDFSEQVTQEIPESVTREPEEQPQTTPYASPIAAALQESRRIDDDIRRQREEWQRTHEQLTDRWNHNWYTFGSATMIPWSDESTGRGIYSESGIQTPVFDTLNPTDDTSENEATDERND